MDKKIGVIEISGEEGQLLALGAESMFMLAEQLSGGIDDSVKPEIIGIILGNAFKCGAFGRDKDRQKRFGDAFAATLRGAFSSDEAARKFQDEVKNILGGE